MKTSQLVRSCPAKLISQVVLLERICQLFSEADDIAHPILGREGKLYPAEGVVAGPKPPFHGESVNAFSVRHYVRVEANSHSLVTVQLVARPTPNVDDGL